MAQNVKMNGRIYQSGMFDDMFLFLIPRTPAPAVGAALGIYYQGPARPLEGSRQRLLGTVLQRRGDRGRAALLRSGLSRPNDLAGEVAELLATGHIVGWVRGGMEGGARALGARSILAARTVEPATGSITRSVPRILAAILPEHDGGARRGGLWSIDQRAVP